MAQPQNQNQQHAHRSLPTGANTPADSKTRNESEFEAWVSWEYPPEFWDGLSRLELSHRALKELDRRTRVRQSRFSHPACRSRSFLSRTPASQGLARYSRHGGPDLSDLRAHPFPTHRRAGSMGPRNSAAVVFTDPDSTVDTLAKTKTKKSTPYNRNFNMHLTDHNIHEPRRSEKPDLQDLHVAQQARRPSLSPSQFSEGAFDSFKMKDDDAMDEQDVLVKVIPTILGPDLANRFCAHNTLFGNLEPVTDHTVVAPKPDIYYGSRPEELARSVRTDLGSFIIPSTTENRPVVPNFFLEVKGPSGAPSVAMLQARYDGAVGSRAMHKLRNYGVETLQYDTQPYAFTSTYQCGTLKLYAHHMTAPSTERGRPGYHMTKVAGAELTDSREAFVKGASALRNALELAEQYRHQLIQDANARALHTEIATGQEAEAQHAEDSADGLPHEDEDEQGEEGESQGEDEEDEDEENERMGSSQSSPSPIGAGRQTSLTPSLSSSRSGLKRQRSPRADASEGRVLRTRSRAVREAESPAPTP